MMTLITRFTCPLTIYFKCYYKVRQVLLQSATAFFVTKCNGLLLQSATAFLLQNATSVITKCDRYYKVWQFYYKMRQVLQSATIITKCDSAYVKRQSPLRPPSVRSEELKAMVVKQQGVSERARVRDDCTLNAIPKSSPTTAHKKPKPWFVNTEEDPGGRVRGIQNTI